MPQDYVDIVDRSRAAEDGNLLLLAARNIRATVRSLRALGDTDAEIRGALRGLIEQMAGPEDPWGDWDFFVGFSEDALADALAESG